MKGTSNMTPACTAGGVSLPLVSKPNSVCFCRTGLVESSSHKRLLWVPLASIPGQVQTPRLICLVQRGFDCTGAWKTSVLCGNTYPCILAKRTVPKCHPWWWYWCLSTLLSVCTDILQSLPFPHVKRAVDWVPTTAVHEHREVIFAVQKGVTFSSKLLFLQGNLYRCTLMLFVQYTQLSADI